MKYIFIFIFFVFLYSEPITPIPLNIKYDKQKARLGKLLFFDPILSKDKKISCASCHKPNEGWSDNRKFSIGVYNRIGDIHSLTILNVRFNFKFNWNGEFDSLIDQADRAIKAYDEMDMSEKEVEERLNNSEIYKKLFKQVFHKDRVEYKDVLKAIVEFEKSLVTPNSKFDRYLKGKANLTKEEEEGYMLFKKYGCIVCHNGINIGGNSFQKIGTIIKYPNCKNDRFSITKNPLDKCVYRVPTLRNITLRRVFFHDGSVNSIEEAVSKMAYYNLGYTLEGKDIRKIVLFLRTLTGELNEK
ncbi:c-type cytochrome [Caminibacter mediatlanticus TB-2]|uniref:C-type cytochrome n=1 Tax=Caminibacter mediatlanticus TB-2 TaxID=391592 RepID=A0ABX5VDM3_9BACT|nr:cytochrome c peroxidase [Caminibacter mediatlanticus]QCT95289.1 c-type cytochrome [Caminibacter mediatlanticus TB-2]